MAELRKIQVCQAPICQQKGSKALLYRLHEAYAQQFQDLYPGLQIQSWDCGGECEQGPMVKINESVLLRHVEKQQAKELLQNPQQMIGEVMHVLEKDRETFDRIVSGEDII